MDYIQVKIGMEPFSPGISEILIAAMDNLGFESFQEDEPFLLAFIPEDQYNRNRLDLLLASLDTGDARISIFEASLPSRNWNEEWERNYPPVEVEGICMIRAPFHPSVSHMPDIIVEPRMSFGTGHHETTRLMLRQIDSSSPAGKTVLDMGCGTGVLGIFSLKKGAAHVTAVDIDTWAHDNSLDNFRKNIPGEEKYEVMLGDASSLPPESYEMILANINRNIILDDLPVYVKHLAAGGTLILSGFLLKDKTDIIEKARSLDLAFVSELYENNWISLKFRR